MNNHRYTIDEVRQAIERGAITSLFKADPKRVAGKLNQVRSTEIIGYSSEAVLSLSKERPDERDRRRSLHRCILIFSARSRLWGIPTPRWRCAA